MKQAIVIGLGPAWARNSARVSRAKGWKFWWRGVR